MSIYQAAADACIFICYLLLHDVLVTFFVGGFALFAATLFRAGLFAIDFTSLLAASLVLEVFFMAIWSYSYCPLFHVVEVVTTISKSFADCVGDATAASENT
jgi:hypothetical protein